MKIWTAEDPVEITQPGLRQVQVHPKIDFTFANAMRAFLRADPDVIMVGEMRDHETAATGVEASLTGHLVFSTLHTNSAPETITRLLDMEIDPFNFAGRAARDPGPAPGADPLQGLQGGLRRRRQEEFAELMEGYGLEPLGPAGRPLLARRSGSTGRRAARSAAAAATRAAWASTSCWSAPTTMKRHDPAAASPSSRSASRPCRDGMTTLLQDGIHEGRSRDRPTSSGVRAVCFEVGRASSAAWRASASRS